MHEESLEKYLSERQRLGEVELVADTGEGPREGLGAKGEDDVPGLNLWRLMGLSLKNDLMTLRHAALDMKLEGFLGPLQPGPATTATDALDGPALTMAGGAVRLNVGEEAGHDLLSDDGDARAMAGRACLDIVRVMRARSPTMPTEDVPFDRDLLIFSGVPQRCKGEKRHRRSCRCRCLRG